MSAHCHCAEHERDPYVQTETIRHGVQEPVVSRHRMCGNCHGLIKVLGDVPKDDFDPEVHT